MTKILLLVMTLFLGIQFAPQNVQAEGGIAYSVKATIPENQINKTLTYFDLKMEPNQKQELILTVTNSSNEEVTVLISPNVAITNQNGVIDYSQKTAKRDSSLKISLEDVISKEQEVVLLPNEIKDVIFTLQMPGNSFEGMILGGFYISQKEEGNEEKNTDKNVQIKNNFSYVIGIKLRQNLDDVNPDLKLNQIKPDLVNYRTVVTANLQNTEATIIRELDVEAKVTKKGDSSFLRETNKSNLSMAPNSNFNFPISWDNQPLDQGEYTLQLVAKSGENEWKFSQDFVIDSNDSNSLNKEAVDLEKKEPNWTLIGSALILGLALVVAINLKRKATGKKE